MRFSGTTANIVASLTACNQEFSALRQTLDESRQCQRNPARVNVSSQMWTYLKSVIVGILCKKAEPLIQENPRIFYCLYTQAWEWWGRRKRSGWRPWRRPPRALCIGLCFDTDPSLPLSVVSSEGSLLLVRLWWHPLQLHRCTCARVWERPLLLLQVQNFFSSQSGVLVFQVQGLRLSCSILASASNLSYLVCGRVLEAEIVVVWMIVSSFSNSQCICLVDWYSISHS